MGSQLVGGAERPRAVSEYLVERMLRAGAERLCFVISPGKSDIVEYYGGQVGGAPICYTVQPSPAGLCDALFRALPFIPPAEDVLVGLPDTVWFPEDALTRLPGGFSFLLFPVAQPQLFDAVVTDGAGAVREIEVKSAAPRTRWIWGAFRIPGATLAELHRLWLERGRRDEYVGSLVNEWLARGGEARAVRAGESYVDVGTLHGYHHAMHLLRAQETARHVREQAEAEPEPQGLPMP
ncbi:MAG TPA: nucleotidyltransferase family protein [Anaeromyxobacteraceae bacterium]|nr:nucleotidyltransferase family protein [Anaeromyxobacteraceae bacterium]